MIQRNIVYEKAFSFAVKTVELYKYLSEEKREYVLETGFLKIDQYNLHISMLKEVIKLLNAIIKSSKGNLEK